MLYQGLSASLLLVFAVACTGGETTAPFPSPAQLPATSTVAAFPTATRDLLPPPRSTPTESPSETTGPLSTATRIPTATAVTSTAGAETRAPTIAPGADFGPDSIEAATLYLELASGRVAPGQGLTVKVLVKPGPVGISGVQFSLNVSPEEFNLLGLAPGALLGPNPLEVNRPDEEDGVALYALARRGPSPNSTAGGPVATISLGLAAGVLPGTTVTLGLEDIIIADQEARRMRGVVLGRPLVLVVVNGP